MSAQRERPDPERHGPGQHAEEPAEGPRRDDRQRAGQRPRPEPTEMDQPAEGGDMPGTEGADRARGGPPGRPAGADTGRPAHP